MPNHRSLYPPAKAFLRAFLLLSLTAALIVPSTEASVASAFSPRVVGSHLSVARRAHGKLVAKRAFNRELGKTILTTTTGHTLYSLSAESKGRFICTAKACLSAWHPLRPPAVGRPLGPVPLGVVKRPDGSPQVTYRGHPLYSFAGDSSPGQAKGEGIKDVGTWHAAVL